VRAGTRMGRSTGRRGAEHRDRSEREGGGIGVGRSVVLREFGRGKVEQKY
jgi:hypothetical protein